eukprot:6066734-Amphidinium_carterae.1
MTRLAQRSKLHLSFYASSCSSRQATPNKQVVKCDKINFPTAYLCTDKFESIEELMRRPGDDNSGTICYHRAIA